MQNPEDENNIVTFDFLFSKRVKFLAMSGEFTQETLDCSSDADECETSCSDTGLERLCHTCSAPDSTCVNTIGSFKCQCNQGKSVQHFKLVIPHSI